MKHRCSPCWGWTLALISAVASTAAAKSVTTDGMSVDPLRIGVILPLSGSQRSYGEEMLAGIEVAVEVLGPAFAGIALQVEDSQSTSAGTRSAGQSLVDRQVSVLLGTFSPEGREAVLEISARAELPLIVPVVEESFFDAPPQPRVFTPQAPFSDQGRVLARYAAQHCSRDKLTVVVDPDGGLPLRQAAEQAGLSFAAGQRSDGAEPCQMILSRRWEFIAPELKKLQRSASGLPSKPRVVGLTGWERFVPQLSSFSETLSIAYPAYYDYRWSEPSSLGASRLLGHVLEKTGRHPSAFAMFAYDAIAMLHRAFSQARSNLPRPLREALRRTDQAPGLLGPLSLRRDSPWVARPMLIHTLNPDGWERPLP